MQVHYVVDAARHRTARDELSTHHASNVSNAPKKEETGRKPEAHAIRTRARRETHSWPT